jgi:rod shape determining protein RodA
VARAWSAEDWRRCDWPLLAFLAAILLIGLPVLYSASIIVDAAPAAGLSNAQGWLYVSRQLVWLALGLMALLFVRGFDYRHLADAWFWLYLAAVLGLLAVLLVGREVNGSRAWFRLGGVAIEPAEPAKLALLVALARLFGQGGEGGLTGSDFLRSLGLLAVPAVLTLLQPDLGLVLGFAAAWFVMVAWAGARWWQLLLIILAALALFALMWHFGLLKDYQKARITVLFNPDVDPRGIGYHLRQALIAVGSGGTSGKGWLLGTQTHLHFLPESRTDFIFAVLCEEWGLLGGAVLLLLYAGLFWRLWGIAALADDPFGRQLVIGSGAILVFNTVLNVGMAVGLLPITGVPLPFFSYGGSNLITSLALIGLVLNVGMRSRHN